MKFHVYLYIYLSTIMFLFIHSFVCLFTVCMFVYLSFFFQIHAIHSYSVNDIVFLSFTCQYFWTLMGVPQ